MGTVWDAGIGRAFSDHVTWENDNILTQRNPVSVPEDRSKDCKNLTTNKTQKIYFTDKKENLKING